MGRKIGLGLLWVGFITYAFLLAPPDQPETLTLIQNLSTGKLEGINPLIVALFNIMGILPAIYSCLLFADGRMQKFPAWPFAIGSFAVGAFALLPYLSLREPNSEFSGKKNWFLKFWDSRLTGVFIALAAFTLVTYGFTQGDWHDFVQQWQTSRFINVMSLDFCLLSLLFPTLLRDDMARRGLTNKRIFWMVALMPLLGAAVYLALRPPLKESSESVTNAELVNS
jgi:hypothetical protein